MTIRQRRLMAATAAILWVAAIYLRLAHHQPWGSLCSNLASTATILASLWQVIGPVQESYRLGYQAGRREETERWLGHPDLGEEDAQVVRIR